MCLIIAQLPTAETLSADQMRIGWENNSDGAGFMYVADGKLVIEKPFKRLQKFYKAYHRAHSIHGNKSHFVLHFRYATHGSKSKRNTHPHELAAGMAGLVHNGILPFDPPWKSDISDTVYFCQTVLGCRTAELLTDENFGKWLACIIGKGNKLVILSHADKMMIVNESAGLWDGSNWYSNTSYKTEHTYTRWTKSAPAISASDAIKGALTCDSRKCVDDDDDLWMHGNTNVNPAGRRKHNIKLSKRQPSLNYVQIAEGEWAHIDDLPEEDWKKYVSQLDDAYNEALASDDADLIAAVEGQMEDMAEMEARREDSDLMH